MPEVGINRPCPWIQRGTGLAVAKLKFGREAMKTIVSSLIVLSALAGVASIPASAFDAKAFYEQQDRSRY
jgi:hypothetical protein